jgi:hypothetical protein
MREEPDFSKAICYYPSKFAEWFVILLGALFFAFGICATLGIEIPNSYTTTPWHGRHPTTPLEFQLMGVIGLVMLVLNLPRLLNRGPLFAIADEGLYFMFAGANLQLIEWNNIERFDSETYGGKVQITIGSTGSSNRRDQYIRIYPVSLDLLIVRMEQRGQRIPLLTNLQFAMHRERGPFRIHYSMIKDPPDLDTVMNQLDLSLAQYRAKVGQ